MNNAPKIWEYPTLQKLVERLRDDLNSVNYVLLFAYNGTGKTRLSMEFKEDGKRGGSSDTLYFNAYTEDLFFWDNDLENDTDRYLRLNAASKFFSGFKELALEEKIFFFLERYADFDFKINYEDWLISFSRGEEENIKISRGEENIFIWCIFLAICTLVIEGHESYSWVKYIYIDDPISSLDDNNAIAVATDLINTLKKPENATKCIISSHHGLFFNVLWNEFKRSRKNYKTYFFYHSTQKQKYTLRKSEETPFFHHVAMLSELQNAVESNKIYTHHFNVLRSIMEKTAVFFGYKDFSSCIHGLDDEVLYARALNLLSHGQYSIYAPLEMMDDNKELFKNIFTAFLSRYQFEIPQLTKELDNTPSIEE
ncbi:AAA family ATPase [Mailhella sp.]